MWIKKVLAWLSLALVISLSQWTGACWEFALEPIKLPFILSWVCSPSKANYCSNPFEVFFFVFQEKKEQKIAGLEILLTYSYWLNHTNFLNIWAINLKNGRQSQPWHKSLMKRKITLRQKKPQKKSWHVYYYEWEMESPGSVGFLWESVLLKWMVGSQRRLSIPIPNWAFQKRQQHFLHPYFSQI